MKRIIEIHAEAPVKPDFGAPCNGCGVCCLAEPCPLGMLVSRRRQGACLAVEWQAEERRYHCGMLRSSSEHLLGSRWPLLDRLLRPLAARWIAAGMGGCDARIELTGSP
ncbi:MAG: hypothetical protein J0L58_03550 [Burkholderiales bacterium]|nr:hypothetical protein [Burkholderiales bacterium]